MVHLGDRVPSGDALVQVGDFLLRVEGVSWSVVSGVVKDRLIVVLRSDGWRKDAGKVAARAFGRYGTAGGHREAARAEIPLANIRDLIIEGNTDPYGRFVQRALAT